MILDFFFLTKCQSTTNGLRKNMQNDMKRLPAAQTLWITNDAHDFVDNDTYILFTAQQHINCIDSLQYWTVTSLSSISDFFSTRFTALTLFIKFILVAALDLVLMLMSEISVSFSIQYNMTITIMKKKDSFVCLLLRFLHSVFWQIHTVYLLCPSCNPNKIDKCKL